MDSDFIANIKVWRVIRVCVNRWLRRSRDSRQAPRPATRAIYGYIVNTGLGISAKSRRTVVIMVNRKATGRDGCAVIKLDAVARKINLSAVNEHFKVARHYPTCRRAAGASKRPINFRAVVSYVLAFDVPSKS